MVHLIEKAVKIKKISYYIKEIPLSLCATILSIVEEQIRSSMKRMRKEFQSLYHINFEVYFLRACTNHMTSRFVKELTFWWFSMKVGFKQTFSPVMCQRVNRHTKQGKTEFHWKTLLVEELTFWILLSTKTKTDFHLMKLLVWRWKNSLKTNDQQNQENNYLPNHGSTVYEWHTSPVFSSLIFKLFINEIWSSTFFIFLRVHCMQSFPDEIQNMFSNL